MTVLVVWFEEDAAGDRPLVGAKAAGLSRLHRAGFQVPPGFTVTMEGFAQSLRRHHVRERLGEIFGGIGRHQSAKLAAAAAAARSCILDDGLDPQVEAAIRDAYRSLSERLGEAAVPVAVRSSASDEDLPDASFAGLQDTYLWVRGEDEVVNRLVHCWSSVFTDRAVLYRAGRGFPLTDVSMAVVVQQMVLPSAAGVALTLDPLNGDRSKIVIDSAFGLGEVVVSGAVTPDHFVVDKVMHEIVRRTISRKEKECVIADDRIGMRDLDGERAVMPSIADEDILLVARLARRIEAHFGCPQDVEWAIVPRSSGPASLYVLQSRPETVWTSRTTQERQPTAPSAAVVDDVVDVLTRSSPPPLEGHHPGFPSPFEVAPPPGGEGWESLYPRSLLFRPEHRRDEEAAFWFRDGVHWPRAIAPFDVTILQFALTSLGQYNSRYFVLPAAMGVEYRILNGYCYLSPVAVDDPATVERRTALFRERAGYYYEHWDALYRDWMTKTTATVHRLGTITFAPLPEVVSADDVLSGRGIGPSHALVTSYHQLIDLCLELWQYHFELLNLGYAAYLEFFGFCKRTFPDVPDLAIARMVAGIDVDLFRPDQELRRLARSAVDEGLAEIVGAGSVDEALARVSEAPAARRWWDDYQSIQDPWFHYSCGTGMYHDDPLWIDRPDIPFGFLRGYVTQLLAGDEIDTPLQEVLAERDRISDEYAGSLDAGRREQFLVKLSLARQVFHYVENHNFYVEHWGHSIFWHKVRELSRVFVDAGYWDDDDSIFMLRREEVAEALWELVARWAGGASTAKPDHWSAEIDRRRRIMSACAAWTAPPMLGTPPAAVNEPFTIMLWGITSESIHGWLTGGSSESELTGFAASPGIAVGPARVVHSPGEIADVRPGEILVTTLTAPSWAPVFRRIAGTVTDTGGIMSHAAIVCREYGLPAVTGTGFATQAIRTGQIVRVDGSTGRVTVLDLDPPDDPRSATTPWNS